MVKTGLDVLLEKRLDLIKGKKIGIITNQTGISGRGTHIVDELKPLQDVIVGALFAPEHGIRGERADSVPGKTYRDPVTGTLVWNLYGNTLKPTSEMLEGLDVLVFDVQDIGTRFYTYISTMGYAMEAAAENDMEFIVLDRPNPITGIKVEGPILDMKFKSFVGMYPIPIMHGITIGELAMMIKNENFMEHMEKLDLTVVPLENWKRDMWFDDTGLQWIQTSPNMKNLTAAAIYPGFCLFEGTNINEGRGTEMPFEVFGAPWINSDELVNELNSLDMEGIAFEPVRYVPKDIPGVAINPKYENFYCNGAKIKITDRAKLKPLKIVLIVLETVNRLYPGKLHIFPTINRLYGNADLRLHLNQDMSASEIYEKAKKESEAFMELRSNYLLYE